MFQSFVWGKVIHIIPGSELTFICIMRTHGKAALFCVSFGWCSPRGLSENGPSINGFIVFPIKLPWGINHGESMLISCV